MQLRPATTNDLALLRRWEQAPHVKAAGVEDWDWENELGVFAPWREHLIAEVNGTPIGFMEIIDPALDESHYWGDSAPNLRAIDIWIGEAAYLGKGHGTRMMRMAIDRCFARLEVEAIVIDPLASNTRALRFYERLNFKPVGRRWFGEDDCMVYRLDRAHWR
jgi:aminoglycoside 6'-N-acetyltransferase